LKIARGNTERGLITQSARWRGELYAITSAMSIKIVDIKIVEIAEEVAFPAEDSR
jgi:hypothetical protein